MVETEQTIHGHTRPGGDFTSDPRAWFDLFSNSLRDAIPVADAAARTTKLAELAAASPSVTPSASNPIYFNQADLPLGYRTLYTVDGVNFISLSGAFVWVDAAARTAATTMAAGDKGYQVDTKAKYMYSGTAWVGDPASCVLRKSVSQNLTTSAVALSWDVEIADSSGMHDNVTNNTRVTAVASGLYSIACQLYNTNASGVGVLSARLNGTTPITGSRSRRTSDAGSGCEIKSTAPVVLAVGDYIEILVSHSSATGSITGGATEDAAILTVTRLGPA